MKQAIITVFAAIFLLTTPSLWAEDADKIDNTIAAGIVFKIVYVLGADGTWSDVESNTPEKFSLAMEAISKDLSSFSDSEHGSNLEKHGKALISFVARGITSTARVGDPEGEKFMKEVGLDPKNADPAKLAEIFTNRIAAYAKLSSTPPWVYDPTKREQVAPPNP